MFARLLLLFLITPVIELALLIRLGNVIGFWPTIAIIIVTGVAGSYLAKREGLSVWRRLNERLASGALPGKELLDGAIILIAGALLITPGVLTDVVGFLGLLPPSRALIRKYALKRFTKARDDGRVSMSFGMFGEADIYAPGREGAPETWGGTAREVPHHAEAARTPDAGPRSSGQDGKS